MGRVLAGPLCPHTGMLTASPPFFPARLRNGVKYCKVLRLPEVSGAASRGLCLPLVCGGAVTPCLREPELKRPRAGGRLLLRLRDLLGGEALAGGGAHLSLCDLGPSLSSPYTLRVWGGGCHLEEDRCLGRDVATRPSALGKAFLREVGLSEP